MRKRNNLYFAAILSICSLASVGCFNNDTNSFKEYEFKYLISDTKAMEMSDIAEPVERKTHLYLRAWDSVRPEIKDGKRGMQAGGEYPYDNFLKVLQPETHMISTDLITGTTTQCADILKAELDEFFKDNGDNLVYHVIWKINASKEHFILFIFN